jgi:imidazole glycerol-phosphate synthase
MCAVTLAKVCQILGAGEIMLNCIDCDGQCKGYDHILMNAITEVVTIPVIASSGAGNVQHFINVFQQTKVSAALAAGIFHRQEVEIKSIIDAMRSHNIPARQR